MRKDPAMNAETSRLPLVVLTNATFPETRALFDGAARLVGNHRPEPWPDDILRGHCRGAVGIMAFMTDRIDGAFLNGCPNLRVIGAALKGFDNIDVAPASVRGVWVTICSPAKNVALYTVVETCETPPPIASSSRPAAIWGAATKPPSRVRWPSASLSENRPPAGMIAPSSIWAARWMFVTLGSQQL